MLHFRYMTRSRLTSVREKKEFRQAIALIAVTIALLVGFIFWGLPAIAGFVGNTLVKSDKSGTNNGIQLKPTMPILTDIPEATNSASIDVNGTAGAGSEVTLYVNGSEEAKLAVPDSGEFNFTNVKLIEGSNLIFALDYNASSKMTSE